MDSALEIKGYLGHCHRKDTLIWERIPAVQTRNNQRDVGEGKGSSALQNTRTWCVNYASSIASKFREVRSAQLEGIFAYTKPSNMRATEAYSSSPKRTLS